mgnify:CR=1 FL=1
MIITSIEKLIGIAKATKLPKKDPEKSESPTIIVMPLIAKRIEIKLINETFSKEPPFILSPAGKLPADGK